MRWPSLATLVVFLTVPAMAWPADGNRLTYLDESDPYYVSRTFPKLITPQWVGEDGVEAVVVLAIDDMREHEKYEAFLRPILRRLQQIDGRAPVSIMTCRIDPAQPHLQTWLKQGLNLDIHTIDHPCPLLRNGDFARAKSTVDRCIDLLGTVPNNRPVAFRVPCCDSLNTPSPRFYAEIFNKTTAGGHFLTIDTSVFNIITANDPQLPRELVLDPDGKDKFRKYVPHDRSFVNTIEDYSYPYIIGRLCWEFPCVVPSDWSAQHLQKPYNPLTVRDFKAALDATVIKQGTFNLVFHPHGWIRNDQVVELIDHVVAKHGPKIKFLNFREAQERLDKHLLGGQPLRAPNGQDNGVRLLDLNHDGYLDVVIGNDRVRQTRLWSPKTKSWTVSDFPVPLVTTYLQGNRSDAGVRFGVVRPDGHASLLVRNDAIASAWHFDGTKWVEDLSLLTGLEVEGRPVVTNERGRDRGVRLRDLDKDGRCELIVGNEQQQAVFTWSTKKRTWTRLPFTLPAGTRLVDAAGNDRGLRFVDVDEDGREDVIFSNEEKYSLHLFTSMQKGWDRQVRAGQRGAKDEVPMIVRGATNNGVWFHSRHLWVQNENTNLLKDLVDRRSFQQLLENVEPGAKSPEASLRSLRARPGFQVELVAAEPLVQDPIAFAWGPDGKFWVVEMGDYPRGTDDKGKFGGRVKYLEDTNGDGKYDKATVFLDGLGYPTGVTPWGRGVLVTCAPAIFYAEDSDHDGKADVRRPLYTGFVEGNQQHRVNGLVWGLDNWLYGANGDSGGRIKSVKTGAVVNIRGQDFRIRPDEGLIDAQTGQSQFGRNRDDWDNWFGCNNSRPMYHFVLADHYQRRNPHLPAPDARVQVSVTPGAAPVYPMSRTLPRFNDFHTANHFTSACGAIVYRDDLFGPAFAGNTFVSEPVHNLVHREVMTSTGVTFTSRRAADELHFEFLASTDNWFRPTMLQTGPDGALWVADMYRHVIEHPQWIPKEWQKRLDLRAGYDKGRIYRVYPVGVQPRPIPRLDRLDTAGLVAALDSPNGWERDLAQQLLVRGKDAAAIPLLEKQVTDSTRPLCRLHALCSLDGLDAVKPALLRHALADAHPGVRRHAVRLCETRLARFPELAAALTKLVNDPDPHVRMQLAYTLGEWDDPQAGSTLGQLAVREAGDRFLLAAVMSSLNKKNLDAVLATVLTSSQDTPPAAAVIENLLRLANALGETRTLSTLLTRVATPEKGRYAAWQYTALAGLLEMLDQRSSSLAKSQQEGNADLQAALKRLAGLFEAARTTVTSQQAPRAEQLAAIRLLGHGLDQQQEDLALLANLLLPQTPHELQAAAITSLGRFRQSRVPEMLLRGWKGYGPGARAQILDILLRRDDWLRRVLDALEQKQILPLEIDAVRRPRLLAHANSAVRDRATKLFAGAINTDRQKVVETYHTALSLPGDAKRGLPVFTKHCAICHQFGGMGYAVGPDLASVGDKSPEGLLIAMLDPNRAVESRYINYVAATKNGLTLTGVLTAETGTSITLLGPEGKQQVILRGDLEELVSSDKSAMPEGLEKDVPPLDVADLIAYIRAVSPPPKRKEFAGNKPELVRPAADGSLHLLASNCEIYGNSLVLESKYGNLGYWSSNDDHAVWTVEVTRPGKYAVWLDWACDDRMAGRAFLLEASSHRLTGRVAGTGNWDTYRQAQVGEVVLSAGPQRVVFRSAGNIAGSLIDLKAIKLVPLVQK